MKNIYFKILFVCIIFVVFRDSHSQPIPSVRIISSDVLFIETKVTTSRNRHYPGSEYVANVITNYSNDYYSLKFSIIINKNIVNSKTPLDVRVISPTNKVIRKRLEETISEFMLDEIYYYDLEIVLNETGWHTLEIGKFSKNKNGENFTITYDNNQIYMRK